MSIATLLQQAGFGCSDNCLCLEHFAASLDDGQKYALYHLAKRGAEERLEAIQRASAADDEFTMMDAQVLALGEWLFGSDDDDDDIEPFQGKLPSRLTNVIDTVPEEVRADFEVEVRRLITLVGGDPERVYLYATDVGLNAVIFHDDFTMDDVPDDVPEDIRAAAQAYLAEREVMSDTDEGAGNGDGKVTSQKQEEVAQVTLTGE